MNSRKFLSTVAVQFGLASILIINSSTRADAATQSWSNAATTTAWSLATNWVSGTAPVTGDDVVLISTSSALTTPNTNISGLSINSLTVNTNVGATQGITLANPLTIGAGGVANNTSTINLFFNGLVTLSANQTWSGTRIISAAGGVVGSFQMTVDTAPGVQVRFDRNSTGWSGGVDVRTTSAFNASDFFTSGTTVTPWGTGLVTLTNQRTDGVTASNPALLFGGKFAASSTPVTLQNNIVLNDVSTGNYTIQKFSANTAFDTTASYQLTGVISGSTNQTLTFSNADLTSTARFILTGSNTYTAGTTINSTSATQKTELYANNAAGSATGFGSVTVNSNSLLGGTGAIRPSGTAGLTVASGGRVNAGYLTTMGTLVVDLSATSGAATFNTGSLFTFDLNTVASSDRLSILGGSATNDVVFNNNALTINQTGTWENGQYVLFTFDPGADYTGTLGSITYTGTALAPGWTSTLTYAPDGNSIYLNVVPEPTTNTLLAVGAIMGFMRMLRRRNS